MPDHEGVQPVKGGPSEAAAVLRDMALAVQAGLGAETAGAVADFAARIRADERQRIVEWLKAERTRLDAAGAIDGATGFHHALRSVLREFGATTHAE